MSAAVLGPRRFADLVALPVAMVVAVVAMALAYGGAWPLAITVGRDDSRFARGFHQPEQVGGEAFRWTDGDSTLRLPRPPANQPALLSLELQNGRAAPVTPVTLTVAVDGAPRAELLLADNLRRRVQIVVPAESRATWEMPVWLGGDAILLESDGRRLGVVVFGAALQPLGGSPLLAPLWFVAWVGVLAAASYLAVRGWGVGPIGAACAAAGVGALAALGAAVAPLAVLPAVQRLAGLALVFAFGTWLARLLIGPVARDDGQLIISGERAVIAMAVAWWMLPLFQLVLMLDGAAGILPAAWTTWGGLGLVLALGVGLCSWQLGPGRRRDAEAQAAGRARIVLVLVALAAGLHLIFSLAYAYTRQAPDFWILYRGARAWARGGSLYDLQAVLTNHFGHVFKVPPFYGMLFLPALPYDGFAALAVHRTINALLILATGLMWWRMWRLPALGALALLVLFNFRPLVDTLAYGQIDLVLLALLVGALWALRGGRDLTAGILVALGTLFKLYPVLLLAFFVLKGRWRALGGFVVGMVVFNGIAVAVMGWEMHRVYLTQVVPFIGGTTSWVENQTISGFVARLVASPNAASIFEHQGLRLLGTLLSGLVSLLVCALALIPAERKSPEFALQYGLFLLLMVLAVPAAWMHYQTLLVVPFGALMVYLWGRPTRLAFVLALATSFGLIAHGNQWTFFTGEVLGLLTIAGVSYKLYGMLLLGALAGTAVLSSWRRPVELGAPLPMWRLLLRQRY